MLATISVLEKSVLCFVPVKGSAAPDPGVSSIAISDAGCEKAVSMTNVFAIYEWGVMKAHDSSFFCMAKSTEHTLLFSITIHYNSVLNT
jgi:hypothetical protein